MSAWNLSVVIVEDEPVAQRRLRDLVEAREDLHLLVECSSRPEAVESIREHRPDLVFLDVRLPDGSGFEVLDDLPDGAAPAVVFVTAYDQFALKAFEVHALDYLLKPFDDERFHACVDRAVELLEQPRRAAREIAGLLRRDLVRDEYPSRLAIRGTGRTLFVDVEEIRWIEAADYYARLHLGSGSQLLRRSLHELEERLDPGRFVRVHRSAIVALERVRELHPTFRGDAVAVLDDGTRVRVSRRHREVLEARLGV